MPYPSRGQNPLEASHFRNPTGGLGVAWRAPTGHRVQGWGPDVPRERRPTLDEGPWFFCLKHHTVETRDGCAERHRLGPFATRAEAEHALEKVAERNEKADAEDRAWEDGDH
jgi:hypothetical protein